MSIVEGQSTAGLAAIATSATAAGSSDTATTARQPPIDIETAAATNPTLVLPARRYASAVLLTMACVRICPSVKTGIVSKRLDGSSCLLAYPMLCSK